MFEGLEVIRLLLLLSRNAFLQTLASRDYFLWPKNSQRNLKLAIKKNEECFCFGQIRYVVLKMLPSFNITKKMIIKNNLSALEHLFIIINLVYFRSGVNIEILNHFVDKNGDILVFWHFYSNHSQSR
jgi:hypothetical protein